jgi:hypothetical protein
MAARGEIKEKPNLSILALISFLASFMIARIFTTFYPDTVLVSGDYHIHHFWYGLAMLAMGGWLGISLENPRTDRLAAILFGAGGGLIGDEIGLLLTLNNYWTEITYTAVILIATFASILILLFRFVEAIRTEFTEFLRNNASLYIGVFLLVVSAAFILETKNLTIIMISSTSAIIACLIVLVFFIQRIRLRP